MQHAVVGSWSYRLRRRAAIAFLQARGAAVDVRDVGRDPDASLDLFNRLGRLGVPAIVIDDRVFVGFGVHRSEIDALLRE